MAAGERRKRETAQLAWPEAASAALGLLVLLFILGVLGYDALAGGDAPPAIVVRADGVRQTPGGHLVAIVASNEGDETAATVRIVARLVGPGGAVEETREATFAYVPAGSERRGGLYFISDPGRFTLRLQAEGYVRP